MKEQLRLDYFLSLGLKLVEGDEYINSISQRCVVNGLFIKELNHFRKDDTVKLYITSFTPRKNTGEQPVGDDVPVLLKEGGCHPGYKRSTSVDAEWKNTSWYVSWVPDLDALIKMQSAHDAKRADFRLGSTPFAELDAGLFEVHKPGNGSEFSKLIDQAMAYASAELQIPKYMLLGEHGKTYPAGTPLVYCGDGTVKPAVKTHKPEGRNNMNIDDIETKSAPEQLIYSKEMKQINATPEAGMLVRVEFNCVNMGLTVATVTYLSQTDKELCLIGEDGLHLIVDVEEFVTWHPVDTRTELEIAKDKQVKMVSDWLSDKYEWGKPYAEETATEMQDAGLLAEIILPLEK